MADHTPDDTPDDTAGGPAQSDPVARYRALTGRALPEAARSRPDWPIRHHHCFQRVVLDAVAGGVWYDSIARPAWRNLSPDQARRAAALAQDILHGRADLHALNRQSLAWRGKLRR